MPELLQFDWLIKQSLNAEADLITVNPSLGEQVRNKIADPAARLSIRKQANARHFKVAIAAMACLLFIGTGISLFLPNMNQAGAADNKGSLINKITVFLKVSTNKEGGYTSASSEIKMEDSAAQAKADAAIKSTKKMGFAGFGPVSDIEEASQQAGFKIKVPAYLPAGAIKPEQFLVSEGREIDNQGHFIDTGNSVVSMSFSHEEGGFKGFTLMISDLLPLTAGYSETTVKINGQPAQFIESELTVNEENEGKQIPNRVLIERKLCWQENGLNYLLTDYTGLSQDELIKVAESLK